MCLYFLLSLESFFVRPQITPTNVLLPKGINTLAPCFNGEVLFFGGR